MLILIVEDDEDTRKIYKIGLENHGYRVVTASHGAEGVAIARRQRPDIILMDIRMPVMDGHAALHYLRSDSNTSKIPVLAISAYFTPSSGNGHLGRRGFDEVLVKPAELTAVVAAVERTIGLPRRRLDQ